MDLEAEQLRRNCPTLALPSIIPFPMVKVLIVFFNTALAEAAVEASRILV